MADAENIATSRNGLPIRLTDERWKHIAEGHPEVANQRKELLRAIAEPERVVAGSDGEMMAVRAQADGKVLVAIYRELGDDGFVITAFLTRRLASLNRRIQLWPSPESTNS